MCIKFRLPEFKAPKLNCTRKWNCNFSLVGNGAQCDSTSNFSHARTCAN